MKNHSSTNPDLTRRRRHRQGLAAVVAAAACTSVGVIALTTSSTPAAEGATEPSAAAVKALPVLAEGQKSPDRLPAFLASGPQSFDDLLPGSTQLLTDDDGTRYWVGTDSQSHTCLVVLLPGKDEVASMTCQPVSRFLTSGITLEADDGSSATRATLVPNGYTADIPGLRRAASSLLIGDPDVVQPPSTITSSVAGKPALKLPRFE